MKLTKKWAARPPSLSKLFHFLIRFLINELIYFTSSLTYFTHLLTNPLTHFTYLRQVKFTKKMGGAPILTFKRVLHFLTYFLTYLQLTHQRTYVLY